jgi:hypothetical protein
MSTPDEPDILSEFIAAETARPERLDGQDEMRERLAASLGLPMPVPDTPAAVKSSLVSAAAVKGAMLLALGFGAGFATRAALPPSSTAASRPAGSSELATITVSEAPPTVSASAMPSARVETIDPSSLPIASASAVPAPSARSKNKPGLAQDVEAERLLLETARVALRRGDREGALRLLQEHKNRYPEGQLREERDGLAVSALTLLGRADEAAKAAARFRKDYPMSLQGAAMPETTDAGR